ncbi:DNA/RNA polymerase [Phytophthora megakarya]|uniref:DNA/RNA polymerase n=1 Tax=Phytophthora megakarya TaxID=4795 RepID=A0A225VHK3_9STRA|nr:DNA/RNA polymerase [Phytophthora megakarya]
MQDKSNGWQPISFASKVNSETDSKYGITELECFVLFRRYLYGRRFEIITDHAALKWLMTSTNLTGKLHQWALTLQEFDFEVHYRPGSTNVVADALSRAPVAATGDADEDGERRQHGELFGKILSTKRAVVEPLPRAAKRPMYVASRVSEEAAQDNEETAANDEASIAGTIVELTHNNSDFHVTPTREQDNGGAVITMPESTSTAVSIMPTTRAKPRKAVTWADGWARAEVPDGVVDNAEQHEQPTTRTSMPGVGRNKGGTMLTTASDDTTDTDQRRAVQIVAVRQRREREPTLQLTDD